MDISLAPDAIAHIGSFPITNTLLMSWLVMLVLVIGSLLLTRRLALVPNTGQNMIELVIEQLYDLCQNVAENRTRVFFPIIATFFLFILASNWLGLLPGLNAVGQISHSASGNGFVPFLRSSASDLNTTLALALISVVLTQYFGVRFKGIYGYVTHYFHNPLEGGVAFIILGILIGGFVGFLEVVSEFVKVISLSFRLFGNVYAGDVVIHTISGLFGYIAPVPFLMLETIVGLVQAAVFALLTLVFFSIISQPIEENHTH